MCELKFYYGSMGSSKTANALMTVFDYEKKGHNVLILKPSLDTRDDKTDESGNRIAIVKSRIGLSNIANVIEEKDNIVKYVENIEKEKSIHLIVCDECQFFTEKQIDELKYISQYKKIPVFCYGLRTDFQTKLFPASERLFEIADEFIKIDSVCKCGRPAIVNARLDKDGNVVTEGDQVEVGGDDRYEGMCGKCWNELKEKAEELKKEAKGWTITYYPWDEGSYDFHPVGERVIGRFKTTAEKDARLAQIFAEDSGFLDEEKASVRVINDYNHKLYL